jgi:peptidoglycan hydrolase CwlO-like protein
MRVAIAKALRNDPTFIAQQQELLALENQQTQDIQNKLSQLAQQVGTINPAVPSTSGVTTIIGVAAAGAAAFFLAR